MSILRAEALSRSFGARDVLRGVSLSLSQGERAGLVGANGAGKTTLLRLLAGRDEPDAGRVELARGTRVGYLTQDPDLPEGLSLRQAALEAFADLDGVERRLREVEGRLAAGAGDDDLRLYGALQDDFQRRGGYDREHLAAEVLAGLGFRPEDLEVDCGHLSGGQRVRAAMARLLLAEPDLLLLDEPTNHLDMEAVDWLEARLARWRGAVVAVSHDRYLLDRVATRIWELEGGRLAVYTGAYSDYARQKAEARARQEEEWSRSEEERRRLEAYVQRYRAGNRARQAQSRQRRLERLAEAAPDRPGAAAAAPRVRFGDRAAPTGREVLAVDALGKAYGDRVLFGGFDAVVERGQRIGLVGPNGAGKTTLLRLLAGEESPSEGEVWWDRGARPALLRQDLGGLDDEATVLETVLEAGDLTPAQARDMLARFLFRGDTVFARVADLSGGERSRLLLCRLALAHANVLLLDEPTNHLDIPAREALEAALLDYGGTLLVASHDRYLLQRVATRIWWLGGGAVQDLPGGYEAYRSAVAEVRQTAGRTRGPAGGEAPPGAAPPGVGGPRAGASGAGSGRPEPAPPLGGAGRPRSQPRSAAPRAATRGAAAAAQALSAIEAEIEAVEAEVAHWGRLLGDPELYRGGGAAEAVRTYEAARQRLDALYARWEAAVAGKPLAGGEADRG